MLPIATPDDIGGIKVGSGLQVGPDGTLSATGAGGSSLRFGTYTHDPLIEGSGWFGRWLVVDPGKLPAGLPGSLAKLDSPPTKSDLQMDITHNGNSIGSVSFAQGAMQGAFNLGSDVPLSLGDRLELLVPAQIVQGETAAGLTVIILGA